MLPKAFRRLFALPLVTFFVVALAAYTVNASSDSARPTEDKLVTLEIYLRAANRYGIPPEEELTEWFHEFIARANLSSETEPQHRDANLLLIGDFYHWIGHVYEARSEMAYAMEAHLKSYEYYKASQLKFSAGINYLGTLSHARFHLQGLARRLYLDLPAELLEEAKAERLLNSEEPTAKDWISYKSEVDRLRTSTEICSSFLSP